MSMLKVEAQSDIAGARCRYAVGDVIVWDNAQLLHAAPLTGIHQSRTLWRITVKEAA